MIDITAGGKTPEKSAVALGIFDGVHSGHRLIFSIVKGCCKKGLVPAVFTFKTESVKIKRGEPFEYIYTNEQKLRLIEKLGIEYIMCPDFDDVREIAGEEFVREILVERMNVGAVICGDNFRFGKNAACGVAELEDFGKKYGFETQVIRLDENRFSSKQYREMLKEGKVNEAYICGSGVPYTIYAEVAHGNKIGRTLEFPTINQQFGKGQLVPRRGVYRTFTKIEGKTYNSVTNIGVKPTVEKDIRPLAETHILDFEGDLYGRKVEVVFVGMIRDERKFSSLDELKKQVLADIDCVRRESADRAVQGLI